jgi:pyruvate kinase
VILGAEKYELAHPTVVRSQGDFSNTEEAIAKAVMYTANRMHVRAIVALTESGLTPLWMSRLRADMPIYAFTRQMITQNRVTLFRGVYPVLFDVINIGSSQVNQAVLDLLLERKLVDVGDLVILTKGVMSGVQGGTNSMQILRALPADSATG